MYERMEHRSTLFFILLPTLMGIDYLFTPMGVDYVVIGFDMEVQPLVTHNAAFCVSAICIDVVSNHLLFPRMQ